MVTPFGALEQDAGAKCDRAGLRYQQLSGWDVILESERRVTEAVARNDNRVWLRAR